MHICAHLFTLSIFVLYSLGLYVSLSFVQACACLRSQLVQICVSMCHSECRRLTHIKAETRPSGVRAAPGFSALLASCDWPHLFENKGSGGWHWLGCRETRGGGGEWEAEHKRGKTKMKNTKGEWDVAKIWWERIEGLTGLFLLFVVFLAFLLSTRIRWCQTFSYWSWHHLHRSSVLGFIKVDLTHFTTFLLLHRL